MVELGNEFLEGARIEFRNDLQHQFSLATVIGFREEERTGDFSKVGEKSVPSLFVMSGEVVSEIRVLHPGGIGASVEMKFDAL